MSSFLTLLKYELKMQFSFKKKKNFDFVGQISSFLISLFIIAIFVFLISQVVINYMDVEINKIPAPLERGLEMLNLFYTLIIVALSGLGVEKMRKVLSQKTDKAIFLRLPVNPQTIFLSKLVGLLITNYITSLLLVLPVNLIFFIALFEHITWTYWVATLFVCIFLPMVPFLIASLLIIPYIKLIDFVKDKYVIVFLSLTVALIGAFLVYSELLEVIQKLLETGGIKFLFNEQFIVTLQKILTFSYPANSFAKVMVGSDLLVSIAIILVVTAINVIVTYFITKNLFYLTLYKNESRQSKNKKTAKFKASSPIASFIKKEFIMIFREPAHVFNYFAIASAMPVMVYSCYTMFHSLLVNTLGLTINFPLALLVILIFSVLINTFCATNISRDGLAILKTKAMPISATKIVLAKVIFCSVVSSIAVLVSSLLLGIITDLSILSAILCALLGIIFSVSQILIATKMDLNHARVSLSPDEVEKESSKTVAKVVSLGLVVSLLIGLATVIFAIFAKDSMFATAIIYVFPIVMNIIYFVCSFFYCKFKLEKKFNDLVM